MISWLKWLLGHVKAWFHMFMGVSDSEKLQVHMDDPPITASLGPIDRLISQLQSLEAWKHNLPVEFRENQIGVLIKHLKEFCISMKKLSEMEENSFIDKWWMKEVREVCYDTEDYLEEVIMQYSAGASRTWIHVPLGRFVGVIIFWIHSKLKWRPQLSHFVARAKVLKERCPSSLEREKPDDIPHNNEIKADISFKKEDRADTGYLTTQLVKLLDFDHRQTQLKVVPIYGLAGTGKTILAMTLYAKYKRRFQCWAFVRVSRNPDIRNLLTSILSQIKAPPASPILEVQDLIGSIRSHLKHKRYFVVIDDVRRTSVWDIISRAFPGDNCGSKIVITTEIGHVASACSGYDLVSTIFKMDDLNACTDTITSEEKIEALNLRYNNLPLHLKTCLLYLNMYPEGSTTTKDDLVKQWIAEGLIAALLKRQDTEEISVVSQNKSEQILEISQYKTDETAEVPQEETKKTAGGYFDELVTRGMIQPVDRNHKGEVLSCTVHHMVVDLIRYKSKEDNFIVVVDNLESTLGHPDIVRRLSVQFGCEKGATIPESIILSKVRSLTFHGFVECVPSIADYGLLRVLILNIWDDEDKIFDLTRIGELYHLRYLKIECNITVRLPAEIRMLQHLSTLELHAEVESIPSDIGYLKKLVLIRCPGKIDVHDLVELTNLLELQLTWSIDENLQDDMESLHSILEKISSLRCLALVPASASGSSSVNTLPANPPIMCIPCDSLCIVFPAPKNLQRLELPRRCCILSRLPNWIGELGKLCILKIAVRELSEEDIDILKRMPALDALSLHVQPMSAEKIAFGKEGFTVLTYFKFTCTVPWLEFEADAMPNLGKLKLCFNSPIVDEQGTTRIIIIGRLSGLKEISAIIGSAGVGAGSAWRKAIKNDSRNPEVQLMGSIYYGDQGRGMVTHKGSGEDENSEAYIRIQMQPESSHLPVPVRCREDNEPEDQPIISEIFSIPSESGSTDGCSGQVVMQGKQTGSGGHSVGRDALGTQGEVNPVVAPREPLRCAQLSTLSAGKSPQAPFAFGSSAGLGSTPPEIHAHEPGFADPEKTVQNISTRRCRNETQYKVLEDILNGVAKPGHLSLELLNDITENFSEGRKIGQGGFAAVYRGVLRNKNVAVKKIFINKDTVDEYRFNCEVQSLMKIDIHCNLVRFLGFCSSTNLVVKEMTGSKEIIYPKIIDRLLCFEYIGNGSLAQYITDDLSGLTWDNRFDIIRGICDGLCYLHENKSIIHMDLKPANILLDNRLVPKITDFGLSRSAKNTHTKGIFITVGYCAPEYLLYGKTSTGADIYSLGIIILELLTGSRQIPDESNVIQRWTDIWNKSATRQQHRHQQVAKCMEIAVRCSEHEPEKRPHITDIVRDLSAIGSTDGLIGQGGKKVVDEVNLMVAYEPEKYQVDLSLDRQEEALSKDIGSSNYNTTRHSSIPPEHLYYHPLESISRNQATSLTSDRTIDLATGAIGSLLLKLSELLKKYNLGTSMKTNVDCVIQTLRVMRVDLCNVSEVQRDNSNEQIKLVKLWADEVRELSYDIEDVIDDFLMHVEGSEPATSTGGFLELIKRIGGEIEDIKNQVQDKSCWKKECKVEEVVANKVSSSTINAHHISALVKDELFGIDDVVKNFTKRLTDANGNGDVHGLKVHSIFGSGGLGKTTLAKAVYDQLVGSFGLTAFVPVGRNPDVKKLLYNILSGINRPGHIKLEADVDDGYLILELAKLLKNNRYLIVIDDLWEKKVWDDSLKFAFVDSKCGSKIIITTRIFEVATVALSCDIYKLDPLSHRYSEELFYATLSPDEGSCEDVVTDGVFEKILEKCGGVPLAIITIASMLGSKQREDWPVVYNSIGFGHEVNGHVDNTRKILLFSYNDLPRHLRTCLLHLIIFPEDNLIPRDMTIWKWVAEGFVPEEPNRGLFEVGERYFNQLINRSMIQLVVEPFRKEICFRVHDLVLDIICSLSKDENFVTVLETDKQHTPSENNVRRLAVQKRNIEQTDPPPTSSVVHLRSYYATACHIGVMPSLSSFKALRVLSMERCTFSKDQPYHLEHIGKLLQLRYLGLEGMPIEELPEEIGNLLHLQTLILYEAKIKELPHSFGLLRQLKCLIVYCQLGLPACRVPDWMVNMTSLEYLALAVNKTSLVFAKGLSKLKELRVLKIHVQDFCSDDNWDRVLIKSIGNLLNLQILEINCYSRAGIWEGFVPPRQLHSIDMGMPFYSFPLWMDSKNLPRLSYLELHLCNMEARSLEILGRFPELHTLKLHTRGTPMGGWLSVTGSGAFPKLRHLYICTMLRFHEGVMPRLEYLELIAHEEELKEANFDCDFTSLWNLPLLQKLRFQVYWKEDPESEDVKRLVDAVSHSARTYPHRRVLLYLYI